MQSPFAFYRGTALNMASDLAITPVTGVRVQVCGEARLGNFRGFPTPERRKPRLLSKRSAIRKPTCAQKILTKAQRRSVIEHDFPKLVRGGIPPTIKNRRWHALLCGSDDGRRKGSSFSPSQASTSVGSGSLCGEEHLPQSRRARGNGPSAYAIGE
jgi:Uncharacterized protein conserved in bacteria (DUF2252)